MNELGPELTPRLLPALTFWFYDSCVLQNHLSISTWRLKVFYAHMWSCMQKQGPEVWKQYLMHGGPLPGWTHSCWVTLHFLVLYSLQSTAIYLCPELMPYELIIFIDHLAMVFLKDFSDFFLSFNRVTIRPLTLNLILLHVPLICQLLHISNCLEYC